MHRIKAILSVLLLLLFSVSIGGAWHYCGGQLAGFSLTTADNLQGCGMQGCQLVPSFSASETSYTNNCCQNQFLQLETDNYQAPSKPDYTCKETVIFNDLFVINSLLSTGKIISRSYIYKHPRDLLSEVDLNIVQVYLL